MSGGKTKGVSPIKRAGVWLLLILISISAFMVTNMMMSGGHPARQPQPQDPATQSCLAVILLVFSLFFLFAGVALYLIVIATGCFTFNYEKPVWHSSFKTRLYICNILTGSALLLGLAGIATALVGPILSNFLGIYRQYSLVIPFLVIFIPGQFILTWINIWKPLICSLAGKRLMTMGVTQQEISTGIFAGVSEPDVSSMKKFSYVEDDIGLLWITQECIRYRGDSQSFEITRVQLTEIERRVDKGSIAAYAGAVHIILHWEDEAGAHMKRVHLENYWFLGALAGLYDDLAGRLEEWKKSAA
ncbi:MAG: hypothetical protein AB9903_26505 [Vulcanimicrobiota bacterium]